MTTPNAQQRGPVLPGDLGQLAEIVEVALSRDGRTVAAAVSVPDVEQNRYRRDVVVGPADATDGAPPLTAVDPETAGAARLPRWSPTDDRLAFVVDGPDGCGVRVVDAGTGAATWVVRGWPDPVEELRWSPEGGRLLFVVREPADRARYETPEDRRPPLRLTTLGYREDGVGWTVDRPRQAYLVDVASGQAPTRLSTGGYDDAEFAWHPDGRSVFFVSRRHEGADRSPANAVFVQELGGRPRTGTPCPPPTAHGSRSRSWTSPATRPPRTWPCSTRPPAS
jgi:dipeptidyl aminopeptidase/acylaminoacyl peptidase